MLVKMGKYPKNGGDRKVSVRIDPHDAWGAYHSLALIIVPLLKMVKEKKQGSPFVDLEDVPEELRWTEEDHEYYKKNGTFSDKDKFHERWEWVIDQMIFSFEHYLNETENDFQFWDEFPEIAEFKDTDNGTGNKELVWKTKGKYNEEKAKIYYDKIQNGLNLFAKYYGSLWT